MGSDVARSILDTFPDANFSRMQKVLFFDGRVSYEECGGYLPFRGIDGSIQRCKHGYCGMASDNTNRFQSMEISEDEYHRNVADMTSDDTTVEWYSHVNLYPYH